MTAAADDKFTWEYVPAPPPPPGKIIIRAPRDAKGRPLCPDLHLTPDMAEQLMNAINDGLHAYLEAIGHENG